MIKTHALFVYGLLVFTFLGCKNKTDSQTSEASQGSEDYIEGEYKKVQGIVLKLVSSDKNDSSSEIKNDIYYVYNIDQAEPKIGVIKNSDSRYGEDDLVTVLVHKENSNLSLIDRRGMVNQELLYQYLTRTDSSFYKMKDSVPFE